MNYLLSRSPDGARHPSVLRCLSAVFALMFVVAPCAHAQASAAPDTVAPAPIAPDTVAAHDTIIGGGAEVPGAVPAMRDAGDTLLPDTAASAAAARRTVSVPKLAIVGGTTVGGFIGGYFFQRNLWWKGERSAFHFDWDHDWRYALGADKLGHFYFPYAVTTIYAQAFTWCGIDTTSSLWLSAGLATAHQTFVEVRDGFSKEWGFSWGDFAANTLGAAYPVLQHYAPGLRNIDFKVSYYPSAVFRAGGYGAIIDDYESTYHWASIDVHGLLPSSMQRWYPSWLNVAVGHCVRDLNAPGGGHHELYLSLDWNLEGLPGDGWFWRLLKKNLNLYHLPAPAVKIAPNVVWYGVHF